VAIETENMNELTDWDVEQLERFAYGNKKAGQLVETQKGVLGRTYNNETLVNGKVRVHCVDGSKLLCDPSKLTLKGFID
jgi:hypothetical protein